MKKISKIFSFIFLLAVLFTAAACSKGSGIKGELSFIARRTELEVTAEFEKDEKLEEEGTNVSLKLYTGDGTYKSTKSLTVENGITGTEKFTGLEPNTEYVVKLFVSYEGEEELVSSIEAKTTLDGDSEENAVSVKTVEEFKAIKNDAEGYYKLEADLDFKEEEISLFTAYTAGFKGTFDGNGHTISNIKLSVAESTGVFGSLDDATIKNLNIKTVTLAPSTTVKWAGALAGYVKNSTIENINVDDFIIDGKTASQSAHSYVGGLVGQTLNTGNGENVIKNCKVTNVSITYSELKASSTPKTHTTGLFAGALGDMTAVEACSAQGTIDATLSAQGVVNFGGFVGINSSAKTLKSCVSDAEITVTRSANTANALFIGGFVGSNTSGYCNIDDSLAIVDINVSAAADENAATSKLAKKAYIAGFVGSFMSRSTAGIKNSAYQPKDTGITVKAMATGTVTLDEDKNVTATTYDLYVGLTFAKVDASLSSKIENVQATENKLTYDIVKATLDDGDSATSDITEDATKLAEIKSATVDTKNINADAKNVLSDAVKNYSGN